MDKPESESLTKGYYWSFGATALPLISAFLCSVIIARTMGPKVVGLINWTMATATVLLIAAKFGVDGASSRLISEYQISDKSLIPLVMKDSLKLRLLFTFPVAVGAYLTGPALAGFFNEPALLDLLRLSSLLIVAVSFNELAALMILGLKKFKLLFMMRGAMLLLKVALVVLAAMIASGAIGVLWAYIAAAVIPAAAVIAYLLGRKYDSPGDTRAEYTFSKLFRLSAFLAVSGASVTIYSLLDKLMLGYFEGAESVGIYSMARNLVETSLFPTFALIMTLRPALAGGFTSGDMERCSYLIRRSLRSGIVYSLAIIVVFFSLSGSIVTGLFGMKFLLSARLLVLFLPLVMMRSIGAVILPGLIAADRAGAYALLTLLGAVLNFVFNALFIPRWGADGAVLATLASYLPIEVLGLTVLFRVFPRFWGKKETMLLIEAGAIGAGLALIYKYLVPHPRALFPTLIHSAVIAVLFLVSTVFLKVVSRDEVTSLLRPLLPKGGPRW